jgi:hypothetical protein
MENRYTSAPWELRGNKVFAEKTYNSIAIICVQENFDHQKWKPKEDVEAIANGKLIAAAPELLEALEKVNNTLKPLIKGNPCSTELMNIINAAIEKATK